MRFDNAMAWLRRRGLGIIMGVGLVGLGAPAMSPAAITSSPLIIAQTMAVLPVCLQWLPAGICLWLYCTATPPSCTIKTSIKVRNQLPDAVVVVRNAGVPHPWVEMSPATAASGGTLAALVAGAFGGIADGNGNIGQTGQKRGHRQATTFRDVDVIGHPMSLLEWFGAVTAVTGGLVCPTRSIPMFPYMLTELDALTWRGIIPIESLYPMALIPGLREIGDWPLNTWGSVYPRVGDVVQQDRPKAAAVLAQRAGDIVTRWAQPHVYAPLGSAWNPMAYLYRWWEPPGLTERNPLTGSWQMLAPKTDPACYTFGHNDSYTPWSWSDWRLDTGGDYIFNLWRPYFCCQRKGAFIGSVP